MGFDCRSVNMRQVNRSTLREIESENESEEELSLIGNVRMRSDTEKQQKEPMDVKARRVYNRLRRSFMRLPQDVQKLVGFYIIVIHVLLFILILKQTHFYDCQAVQGFVLHTLINHFLMSSLTSVDVYWVKVDDYPWWPATVRVCYHRDDQVTPSQHISNQENLSEKGTSSDPTDKSVVVQFLELNIK